MFTIQQPYNFFIYIKDINGKQRPFVPKFSFDKVIHRVENFSQNLKILCKMQFLI